MANNANLIYSIARRLAFMARHSKIRSISIKKILVRLFIVVIAIVACAIVFNRNNCIIVFKDYDGFILQVSRVKKGEIPVFNKRMNRNTGIMSDYSFYSWDKPLTEATANTVYNAVYRKRLTNEIENLFTDPHSTADTYESDSNVISDEKQKYLIIFKDEDGTILQEIEYEYGEIPYYDSTKLGKIEGGYVYSFKSWLPFLQMVTKSQTYFAIYDKSPIK